MAEASWETFVAGWELFRDPLLCAAAAGAVLGFLGVYVVLRRMVFVTAAVTQAAALGVALGFYCEIHLGVHVEPLAGAAAAALAVAWILSIDPGRLRVAPDTILAIVFAATGGATLIVGDRIAQEAHDIQAILFGSAVLVRPEDLWAVTAVGAAVLAVHLWWLRGISFAAFARDAAAVQGLPVRLLNALVTLSVAAIAGVAARALGALPVFALSVLPAAAALLLGLSLRPAFAVASALGVVAGTAGYATAFFLSLPVGASQTTVAAGLALVALACRVAWLVVGGHLARRRGHEGGAREPERDEARSDDAPPVSRYAASADE
jgi:zinc transport system permease protein